MRTHRYRPSRPVAILAAVLAAVVLVFGLVRMLDGGAARDGGGLAFLVLWSVAGVAVVGVNVRAAVATGGSPPSSSRVPDDEGGPSR